MWVASCWRNLKGKVGCGHSAESEVWGHTAFPPNMGDMCVSQEPVVAMENHLPGSRVFLQGLFQKSCWEGHGTPSKESVRRRTPENQGPEWQAGPVGTASLLWGWRWETRAARALQEHPKAPVGETALTPQPDRFRRGKTFLSSAPSPPLPSCRGVSGMFVRRSSHPLPIASCSSSLEINLNMELHQNFYYSTGTVLGSNVKGHLEFSKCTRESCGTRPGLHAGVGEEEAQWTGFERLARKRTKQFLLCCKVTCAV